MLATARVGALWSLAPSTGKPAPIGNDSANTVSRPRARGGTQFRQMMILGIIAGNGTWSENYDGSHVRAGHAIKQLSRNRKKVRFRPRRVAFTVLGPCNSKVYSSNSFGSQYLRKHSPGKGCKRTLAVNGEGCVNRSSRDPRTPARPTRYLKGSAVQHSSVYCLSCSALSKYWMPFGIEIARRQ